MKNVSRWLLTAALALGPAHAFAQELRCPAGYESLPAPGGGDQRVLAACVQGPMQIVVSATSVPITPAGTEESDVIQQIATRLGQDGHVNAAPVRTETIAGVSARVAELAGQVSSPDGTTGQIEGMMVLIPAQGGTVVVMALSRNPTTMHVAPAVRAIVPTITGLGAAPIAWRAGVTCPPGTTDAGGGGIASNGMRRVARCQGQNGVQIEVLESMLPLRNEADSRAPAMNVQRSIGQQLQQLGGTARIDATQPFEVRPGVRGSGTAIHGTATDPRAPAGAPDSTLRIEGQIVVLPTQSGHVEIIAIAQGMDAPAVAALVHTMAHDSLTLDGSNVHLAAAPTPAGATDGGAAPSEPGNTPPAPRRREIDPNQPLWQPPPEDRPRASTPAAQPKSCGCRTPGSAPPSSATLSLAALLAIAFGIRKRRAR